MGPGNQSAFWDGLAKTMGLCQSGAGHEREAAWRELGRLLRPWARAVAQRHGVISDAEKDEYLQFLLAWLAMPGRIDRWDPKAGTSHAWIKQALQWSVTDFLSERRPIGIPLDGDGVGGLVTDSEFPTEQLILEARDELSRIPEALRVAFVVLHDPLLGPLSASECVVFEEHFGLEYGETRPRLRGASVQQVAAMLGKTTAWAYQVRSRVLKRLREALRDTTE